MLNKIRKAQSTAEYAILLSLVVAAAMGIQHEVRRAIQARIHDAAVGLTTGTGGTTTQYDPSSGWKNTNNQQSNRTRTENYVNAGSDEPWITISDNSSAEIQSHMEQ